MSSVFRLAVVYVEYDTVRFAKAFEQLRKYLEHVKWFRKVFVIVNNKEISGQYKVLEKDTFFLPGDNTEREFSGWQKGIDFLYSQNIDFDVVLFVNEVFEVLETSYLKDYANDWILLRAYLLRAVIGRIDRHGSKTRVLGYSTNSWVCTNCFFVPKVVLDRLRTIITVDHVFINDFLEENYSPDKPVFKPNAPINEAGKNITVLWLTEMWRSKFTLNEESWTTFREKTKAILNEKLFSARIREAGFLILPYNIHKYYISGIRKVMVRNIKKSYKQAADFVLSFVRHEA